MSQSNEKYESNPFSKRFTFEHASIHIFGYYAPCPLICDRECAYITYIGSLIPERQIQVRDIYHTKSGHLKPALEGLESIVRCEEYWGVLVVNVVNEFLPAALIRYGYQYEPKTKEYYKFLKGYTRAAQNDPKILQVDPDF